MLTLSWYCERCRKLIRSSPPGPRYCKCETPVVPLFPTKVWT